MSENELGAFCDEQKILEYVYEDVDDSDIFATESLNNSFTESESKTETDPSTNPVNVQDLEKIQEHGALKETVEQLQIEKEILQLRISELYKTAKAELERKDRRLKDLEKEKDNILFRRQNNFNRNKPTDVDTRVPVLQQVENDLTNEEYQNFSTRYRIPRKVVTSDNNGANESKELHKILENKHIQKGKYNSDEKYWSAYPHLIDKPIRNKETNEKIKQDGDRRVIASKGYDYIEKEDRERGPLVDKDSHDRHVTDRSRPRERLDQRKPVNRGNETIRSPSNKDRHSSIESYKQKYVYGRSKSSSKFKNGSPESYTRRPRSSSKEKKEGELPNKRDRSESMNEDVKLETRRIYSSSISREEKDIHLTRERSRSPSIKHYKKEYVQKRTQSQSRVPSMERQNEELLSKVRSRSPPNKHVRKPSFPSMERRKEELQNKRNKSELVHDVKPIERRHSSPNSRPKGRDNPYRERNNSECFKRQPRTPSVEIEDGEVSDDSTRSRSQYKDRKSSTTREEEYVNSSTTKRINSFSNKEKSKQRCSKGHSWTASMEKECNLQSFTQTNQSGRYEHNKRDFSSISKEKADICTINRRNRLDSQGTGSCKEGTDDHNKRDGKVDNNYDISEDKEVRSSESNVKTSIQEYLGRGPLWSSSREKGSGKSKVFERLGFKDNKDEYKGSKDERRHFDRRDNRRSRSVSGERGRKRDLRRSRSTSKERYRKPSKRDRYDARNWRGFDRDASKSSSAERDRKEQFKHKPNFPLRRDRYRNINYKYRENRSRSKSMERLSDLNVRELQNREGKSRPRNISQLRERVLRYSMDRGTQSLKQSLRENQEIDKALTNNETDQSDLDDLQLHLSGESDQDSLSNQHVKRRNEMLNSGNVDFELVKDVGISIQHMTDEELERLVETRKKEFNKVSNLSNTQKKLDGIHGEPEFHYNVQFVYPDEKLADKEEYDTRQTERKESVFWHSDNYIEELDYEHSQSEFPNNFKEYKKQELPGIEPFENEVNMFSKNVKRQHQDRERLKNPNEEKMGTYQKDYPVQDQEPCRESTSVDCNGEQFRTIYERRQHQKSKTIRKHIETFKPVGVNFLKEKPGKSTEQRRNQTERSETQKEEKLSKNCDIPEKNTEIRDSGQEQDKEKLPEPYNLLKHIDTLKQEVIKVGQECHSTRDEITATLSKITKDNGSNEKYIFGNSNSNLRDKDKNQSKILGNGEKDVDHVESPKRERITFNAYKSRKKSIDVQILDIDLTDSVNCATNVSENNQIETNIATKSGEMLKSKEKPSVESADLTIDELPETEGVGKESSNIQENFKNKNVSNEFNNQDHVFVRDKDLVIQETSKKEENFTIGDKTKRNETNIPIANNIEPQEHAKINDSVIEDSSNRAKQENELNIDPNSFIHDFSFSDDEDTIQAHATSDEEENLTVDCNRKINILSNITIQSPSYTPPHPKNTGINVLHTSENALGGNNSKLKSSGDKKSRKSLFKTSVCEEETEKAVTNIPGTTDCNRDTAENTSQISDNFRQIIEIDSGKTNPAPLPGSSQYVDEIQEAVKNIMGETSPHYSSSSKSNVTVEHFDTEELQKCLEEDITRPSVDNLNQAGTDKTILSLDAKTEVCKTEIDKNKVNSSKGGDEHEDKTKQKKRDYIYKKNKRVETSPPKEKSVEFDAEKMFDLFGPMTPSPGKTEDILEQNVNRVKVKRNIIKCQENDDDYARFKVREKKEDANEHNCNKKVINIGNENLDRVSEGKQKIVSVIISPEEFGKYLPLLKKPDDKRIKDLKNFCTNPTYIPNIRDTPKAVFESPNHYIQKKNIEMKEKIKRNLNEEDPLSNKMEKENVDSGEHRLMEEKSQEEDEESEIKHKNLSKKSVEKNVLSISGDDFVVKDKSRKKTKPQKCKKEKLSRNSREDVKTAGDNGQKVKGKRGAKNIQNKNGDKKTKNSSFKIKINIPKKPRKAKENVRNTKRRILDSDEESENVPIKKRWILDSDEDSENVGNKKRWIPDSDDDSDSFEERKKSDQKKRTAKDDVDCVANDKAKNKKRNLAEKDCIKDLSVFKDPPLSDSYRGKTKNPIEIECKNNKLKRNEEIKPRQGGRHRKVIKCDCQNEEGNGNDIKKQTCDRLNEEQKESCESEINFKECNKKNKKITVKNEIKARKKSIKEASVKSIPSTSNTEESVKTVKRITPKRIGDCTLTIEIEPKFTGLKSQRELFIEYPESDLGSSKRKRLSCVNDDCRAEKYQKIIFTESRTTVGEDVLDNGSQARIKVQETQLTIEVAPNCSPLPRIEQTYDILSKNTALSKGDNGASRDSSFIDASNPQLQPTHEGVFPAIVLSTTENTLPEINLDTKDLTMLGPMEKDIYFNLSEFSLSDKSTLFSNVVGESKKSDKDSNDDNIGVHKDKNVNDLEQLSFKNFLNNKNPNTSTPIKNSRPTVVKCDLGMPKHISVSEENSQRDIKIIQTNDNLHTDSVITSNSSTGNTVITSVRSTSGHNANFSGDRTSPGMASSVSNGSGASRPHVKFSRTLKRDRRRPISMIVLD